MKEILPVPVALAKDYLTEEEIDAYAMACRAFYNAKRTIPEIEFARGVVEFALKKMPAISDASPFPPHDDLTIKYHQLQSMHSDMTINHTRGALDNGFYSSQAVKEFWEEKVAEAEKQKTKSRDMLSYYAGVRF